MTNESKDESLHLEGEDAKAFVAYMSRKATKEELASYEEADKFYNSKHKS